MGYIVYTAKDAINAVSAVRKNTPDVAVGFLTKPFDATALADAIESALSPGDNWQPLNKAV
jgi:FixJ family two-component response regulator